MSSYAGVAVVCLVSGVVSVLSIISLQLPISSLQSVVLTVCIVLPCYCWLPPLYYMIKTLPRDIRYRRIYNDMWKEVINHISSNNTVHKRFNEIVSKYPDKSAILFEDEIWTFKDLDCYSNQVAHALSKNGFKHGDCIALFMTNCPQYVGILLGTCKIGVEVALINYNLRDSGLLHCIRVSKCSGLIYEKSLEDAIEGIYEQFSVELQSMCLCSQGIPNTEIGQPFDFNIKTADEQVPVLKEQNMNDVMCYIYTSGTTGLPKAVPIRYSRFNAMVAMYPHFTSINDDDVIYNTLPLYHSSGGVLAMGQCYTRGTTVALRRKFSASKFFSDCIKYKCTMFIYIGELCRYLVLQPPSVMDTQHSIRTCFGNGLRPEVWKVFQKRFAIPEIIEFYGSTEGTFMHVNINGKEGAIGSYSPWVRYKRKIYFIKVHPATGEVIRNSQGLCIEVKQGEEGEMIAALAHARTFTGYKDSTANSKRLLTDVFAKGDIYYRSGDIARYDEEGYIYFSDRAGDTFRWKGENVSTTEVENTISSLINQRDVIVYGIRVPSTEGRAGMAVVVGNPTETIDLKILCNGIKQRLPSYSIPVFIRFVRSSHLTGTFKFHKVQYVKEGFDVRLTGSDEVYVWDSVTKEYVVLTEQLYWKITNGELRF